MASLTLREVVWPLFHSKFMFIVPWYGFPWWLSLGLIPWHFPFASVVGLCGFLFVIVASLVCLVASWLGGLALAPLCWFASVSGPVVCPGFFWCSPAAALPSGPPTLGVISGSEGFPSVVSVWISGCFGNGLGVRVFVLYGNKGFGPVWGTSTPPCCAWRLWSLASPSESASRGPTTPLPAP